MLWPNEGHLNRLHVAR